MTLQIDSSGNVYITDSKTGWIYTINKAADTLASYITLDSLYPNGIDIDPQNKHLFIATFSGHIMVLDIRDKKMHLLAKNIEADGLYYYNKTLVAVSPANLLIQCFLDDSFRRIVKTDTLQPATATPFSQPTTGAVVGARLYFIKNSQLQLFKQLYSTGNFKNNPLLRGPVIDHVKLKESRL